MDDAAKRFVIVGGGTAGWLAALMLQAHSRQTGQAIDIAVVESSRIPTIGVGEGTTAVFRQVLDQLEIDEPEFIRETGATIKFGIRHRDWRRKGHSYDGPIDDPNRLAPNPAFLPAAQASALDIYAVSSGTPLADIHMFGHLMRSGKSPFAAERDGEIVPAGPFQYAYHFDQARVGAYLRSKASGIEMIDAEVEDIRQNPETGLIEALLTKEGKDIAGDFFFDCTGFRRRLIEAGLGGKWISYADSLPVNRAMPFWVEHDEDYKVAPYTLAWAQEAGWMWSIPTQDRIGCGYVYCDRFVSPDEAKQQIEQALGREIEPRADLRFNTGRIDRVWIANCVALGLSSSFLEPLEATSIHGTVVQMMMFTRFFADKAVAADETARASYNEAVARQVDDFRDFINLHYSGERDEPFWQYVREECLNENTRARLAMWGEAMPRGGDFAPFPGNLPHVDEVLHYPVLDGLGHLSRKAAKAEMAANPKLRAHARKTTEAYMREFRRAAAKCMDHGAYLKLVASGGGFRWQAAPS